jgi:hypothetical protein
MVGQLLRLLWEAEAAGSGRYSICVTGDHSTPVAFGDHSHEPVPLAVAHVRHAVGASGRAPPRFLCQAACVRSSQPC